MRKFLYSFVLLLLCSCTQQDLLEKFSSPEDQATAKNYINFLRSHNFDAIEKNADPRIQGPALHPALEQMASLIPAQEPSSVKLVGAQSFHGSDAKRVNTTFEYDFSGTLFLINVAIEEKNSVKTIVGFNVVPEAQSLQERNRFTLQGKSGIQYATLSAALVAALLSLYALIICVKTKLTGRKWPWVLFIILGLGNFSINWATGQYSLSIIALQLFSAGAFSELYGPWIVSVSAPVGAIIFLIARKRLTAKPAEAIKAE